MRSSKNFMSSARCVSRAEELGKSSARGVVVEVGEGDLGSIIQNSARWRLALLFSARKVGPKV